MKLNHDKKAMINGLINYNTFNVKPSLPIGFLFIIFVQSSLQDGLSEKKFPQQSTIYKKNSKDISTKHKAEIKYFVSSSEIFF